MNLGEVIIHRILPGNLSGPEARALLTAEEIDRAGRFKFQYDADSWSANRAGLRYILGIALDLPPREVPIVLSETGKPLLSGPYDTLHFNLSHCDGLALVALSNDGPVGIDLEPIARAIDLLDCENAFCHPDEIAALPEKTSERAHQLLRIWTAKEAMLKALGTGLTHPPEAVVVDFTNHTARSEKPLTGIETLRFQELSQPPLAGFQAVVSLPVTFRRVELF
jgi:4'-phosphopantetheinyl transferase